MLTVVGARKNATLTFSYLDREGEEMDAHACVDFRTESWYPEGN